MVSRMTDYIDRQAARRTLGDFIVQGVTPQDLVMNFREIVLNRIDTLPPEDVVPVVRCKDCKLNRKWNDWLGCPMIGIGTGVQDDDYCSRGIRKDG